MEASELKSFVDLVADVVVCRLKSGSGGGGSAGSEEARLAELLEDIKGISRLYGTRDQLVADIRKSFDTHEFERVAKEIGDLGRLEPPDPPDDLVYELRKLAEKLRRLQDEENLEYKFPTRLQINVKLLVDILLEILDILKKLGRRSMMPERGPEASAGAVSAVTYSVKGVTVVRRGSDGGDESVIIPSPSSELFESLDKYEAGVVKLAFETIAQAGGGACTKVLLGAVIGCVGCGGDCHVLRHPTSKPADSNLVEDLGTGKQRMVDGFAYWCHCGPYKP